MKRTIVSTLILLLGAAAAYAVVRFAGMAYIAASISVVAIVWAYMWHLEEIKVTSWHYRVAEKYFDDEVKKLCKACPYWGLVALATFAFVIEYAAKIIYGAFLQVGFYVWASIAWLFGYFPVYKRLTYTGAHSRKYHLFLHTENGRGPHTRSKVWPILTIGPIVALVVLLHFGTGTVYGFYGSTAWYYGVLISYGAMLAMVVVGNIWRNTGWVALVVATKWSYRKSCPDIKIVQPVAATAKPQRPNRIMT